MLVVAGSHYLLGELALFPRWFNGVDVYDAWLPVLDVDRHFEHRIASKFILVLCFAIGRSDFGALHLGLTQIRMGMEIVDGNLSPW